MKYSNPGKLHPRETGLIVKSCSKLLRTDVLHREPASNKHKKVIAFPAKLLQPPPPLATATQPPHTPHTPPVAVIHRPRLAGWLTAWSTLHWLLLATNGSTGGLNYEEYELCGQMCIMQFMVVQGEGGRVEAK